MSEQTIQSIINSIAPILITLIFAWLSSRNEQAKRRNLLEDSRQRIELINSYVTSQSLVVEDPVKLGEIKRVAARELDDIKTTLDLQLSNFQKGPGKSENYWQRFFLVYRMQTRLASLFRAFFFLMLIISLFWSLLISSVAFSTSGTSELDAVSGAVAFVILLLPVILIVFVLRWLAIKFDKPAEPVE